MITDTKIEELKDRFLIPEKFISDLDKDLRARDCVKWIVTDEESRCEEALRYLAMTMTTKNGPAPKKIYSWSITNQFHKGDNNESILKQGDYIQFAKWVMDYNGEDAIIICKYADPYLDDPIFQGMIRDIKRKLYSETKSSLIFLSSIKPTFPRGLDKVIITMDFPYPQPSEIEKILRREVKGYQKVDDTINASDEIIDKLVIAMSGLISTEIETSMKRVTVSRGIIDDQTIHWMLLEKEKYFRGTGMMDYIHTCETFNDVGGMDLFKSYLKKRAVCLTDKKRAIDFRLPMPKGVLLLGIQGCGKSLMCRAIASEFSLPLIRVNLAAAFGGIVGETENNVRMMIKRIETSAPNVAWFDEIEKGTAGMKGDGRTDGGTTKRSFGQFISWTADRYNDVKVLDMSKMSFLAMTANDITDMPPEFTRKGRLDNIFFVDLPNTKECEEIISIGLKDIGRLTENFKVNLLARDAREKHLTGAEIKNVIESSMYDAFGEHEELNTGYIRNAMKHIVPIYKTYEKEIHSLREWAKNNAELASSPESTLSSGGAEI